MSSKNFFSLLSYELERIDSLDLSKRQEKVIEGFTQQDPPKAIIEGKNYYIFNSNDYLSLRFHPRLKQKEKEASEKYGTGPGAVRFISGTFKIHKDLEKELAKFHQKEEAMIFSSAFAANQGVIFPLIVGQTRNTIVSDKVLVVSDELNHRSIIDAIRLAKLPKEQKAIFKHFDTDNLESIVKNAIGNFDRVLIITDGVFSMLGEVQKLKEIADIKKRYDEKFKNGILIVVDDAHGVGVLGKMGRGSEEEEKCEVDVLIGTFGKAFGTDGGYVVSKKIIIDYLRESAATYIYSNNLTPGTAGASLEAIKILQEKEGFQIRKKLIDNINYFKKLAENEKIPMAANSFHPIQPVLIGDPKKTKKIVKKLFADGFLTTAISYPVVPQGRDEIRIQINANHNKKVIDLLIKSLKEVMKKII
jgi:7-keto-8-aminopelargonate synthetase and related enzymes